MKNYVYIPTLVETQIDLNKKRALNRARFFRLILFQIALVV